MLFPPLCTGCKEELDESALFCKNCFSHLELLSLQQRCHRCFALKEKKECCDHDFPFVHAAAAFEHKATAAALLEQIRSGEMPDLKKAIAGFMFLQLGALNWPKFDLIVSAPGSILASFLQGYHSNQLIAEELAKLLGCRARAMLKYDGVKEIYWKRSRAEIADMTCLLVDDVMSKKTVEVGKVLREGFPKHLFALSFTTTL